MRHMTLTRHLLIQNKSTYVENHLKCVGRGYSESCMTETLSSGKVIETTDPRILRSRRMLMDALVKLLTDKEFEEISIQEIAD